MCPRTYFVNQNNDDSNRWNNHLTLDDFRVLLDGIPGLKSMRLHGLGEPLTHPYLLDMITLAASYGVKIIFTTNATLLDPATSMQLIQRGIERITFSIDSANAFTYENIRVGARFDEVISNIRWFMKYRSQKGQNNIHVSANVVITKENINEIEDILGLCQELEIYDVTASILSAPAEQMETLIPKLSTWKKNAFQAKKSKKYSKVKFDDYGISKPSKNKTGRQILSSTSKCSEPWIAPFVRIDGFITPCCNISGKDVLGNLNVFENGFDKAWNSQQFQEFRRLLKYGPVPSCCMDCPQK
jgi:MoaA/NifB/PqqE/SkfB family radical SAM enzyme